MAFHHGQLVLTACERVRGRDAGDARAQYGNLHLDSCPEHRESRRWVMDLYRFYS